MTREPDNRSADDFSKIGHHAVGNAPLLKPDDLDFIVEATGAQLIADIERTAFLVLLNEIVAQTIHQQLTRRFDRKAFDQLMSSFEAYRDVSRELIHSEFPPPQLPPKWIREFEGWAREAETGLAARKRGGAPHQHETVIFLPRAAGLFHAGFSLEPVAMVSWDKGNEKGAAFRFVHAVRSCVRERIDQLGFTSTVDKRLRAKARWGRVTDDALAKRLSAALVIQSGIAAPSTKRGQAASASGLRNASGCGLRPDWQWYSDIYRSFLLER
jgi:hypothetical protein